MKYLLPTAVVYGLLVFVWSRHRKQCKRTAGAWRDADE